MTNSTDGGAGSGSLARQWSERTWTVIAAALLLNSTLRGIRTPSRWAYTHLLLNYDFGFAKRSLQGALISAMSFPALYRYSFCFWYDTALLTANVLLLFVLLRRLCATQDVQSRTVVLAYSSSLAVVVLAHTIGYGDQFGLLVTLLALLTRRFFLRCLLIAVLFTASVLVHETQFAIFFPIVLLRFRADLRCPTQTTKLLALCGACLCVGVALLCVGHSHLSEAQQRPCTTPFRQKPSTRW